MPMFERSWKPASGPSVAPVPRSTRKLNCEYGRSRRTAMSAFRNAGIVLQPDQIIEGQLELLVGDVVAHSIEAGPRPAARPRSYQSPRIQDFPARGRQLTDGDVPTVVLAVNDEPAPVVEVR